MKGIVVVKFRHDTSNHFFFLFFFYLISLTNSTDRSKEFFKERNITSYFGFISILFVPLFSSKNHLNFLMLLGQILGQLLLVSLLILQRHVEKRLFLSNSKSIPFLFFFLKKINNKKSNQHQTKSSPPTPS